MQSKHSVFSHKFVKRYTVDNFGNCSCRPPETDTVETEVEEANKRQGQYCCCCTWCVETMGNALINLSFSTVHQGHRSHVEHQETERRKLWPISVQDIMKRHIFLFADLLNKHQHLWTWQPNVWATLKRSGKIEINKKMSSTILDLP